MAKFAKTVTVDCPYCRSAKVVKNGLGRQAQQRYLCKVCRKRFTNKGATDGRQYTPNVIGAAVRMFYSGMSYKQIAENIEEQYDVPEPSKGTLFYWVQDYTGRAHDAMKGRKAQTGREWVADEMAVKVGGQQFWNWNVMDSKTRYILASHLSKRRTTGEAVKVFEKARANAVTLPKTIKTDRLASYIDASERVFGADVKHVQSDGIRAAVNNNLSERLQGTFRSRTKTLRGLDSRATGQDYLDGWVLTYNLFRDHESLGGRTPGEAAKVDSPFKSWEDVVVSKARATPTFEVVEPSKGKAEKVVVVRSLPAPKSQTIKRAIPKPKLAKPVKPITPSKPRRKRQLHPYLRKGRRAA